MNKVDWDKAS